MIDYNDILEDQDGGAVVEATILFPIMFMIFFGIVILALYLPTRSALQYATQYTANALAAERSDTWLTYNESQMRYEWVPDKSKLDNVYVSLFNSLFSGDYEEKATKMVTKLEEGTATFQGGDLEVHCYIRNYVIYKEIIVTATRTIPSPINLSFVGFPTEIPITVSSTAVVKNGDEFVRNVDLAVDFTGWLRERFEGIDKIFTSLEKISDKYNKFFGI